MIRLEDVKNALIFCNRKRDVDILYRSLLKHDFDVVQLHGDMAQASRTETLERFKTGVVRLMVCSDVAARGLDILDLSHVFNFDVPYHCEDYIHRIGRTGRAGKTGRSFTIATPEDGKFLDAIIKLIGKEIPRVAVEGLPDLPIDLHGGGRRRGTARSKGSSVRDKGRKASPRRQPDVAPAAIAVPAREGVIPPVREIDGHDTDRQRPPERVHSPRGNRDRVRRDHRHRGDDHSIGEMSQPDGVVGFGTNAPDFMRRAVVLPAPTERKRPAAKGPKAGAGRPADDAPFDDTEADE